MRSLLKFLCFAVMYSNTASAPASASELDYIFTGTGSGTIGTSSFNGSFSVDLTGDTTNITNSGTGLFFLDTVGTFTYDGTTVAFTDPTVESNAVGGFMVFGDPQNTSAQGLLSSTLVGYDLSTAFPLTSGDISYDPNQIFGTAAGDLDFTDINSLSFEAIATTPLPQTWVLMLGGLAGIGFLAYRRNAKASFTAA